MAVIILGIFGFLFYGYIHVSEEKCEFLDNSGLKCANFDVTTTDISLELRNIFFNNTITINSMMIGNCTNIFEIKLVPGEKGLFILPCELVSGSYRGRIVVDYKVDDFQRHTVGKIQKVIA